MACILVCLLRILLASHLFYIISASNGFSSTLIHGDSPYSPLYQSNLSHLKAFWRDIKTSRIRAANLISLRKFEMESSTVLRTDILQLSLFFRAPLFTLEVGIGTPTKRDKFLILPLLSHGRNVSLVYSVSSKIILFSTRANLRRSKECVEITLWQPGLIVLFLSATIMSRLMVVHHLRELSEWTAFHLWAH